MAIVATSIRRAAVVWKLSGSDEQINVYNLYFSGTVPADQDEVRDGILGYFDELYGSIVGQMSTDLVHNRIELFDPVTGNPDLPLTAQSSLNGVNTGERLPPGVAAFVYGRTGISRRIARKFLPTFCENNLTAGQWGATTVSALNTYAATWMSDFDPSVGWAIRGGVFTAPNIFTDIIQAIASPEPAYQRRRRPGRGS